MAKPRRVARQLAGSRMVSPGAPLRFRKLSGFAAVEIPSASFSCARRCRMDARRDGVDDYKVIMPLAGAITLTQDERTTRLAAGDIGLVDVTRLIEIAFEDQPGRVIGLHLPRKSLISHLGFEPQGGLSWRADALPARLLQRFVMDHVDTDDDAPESTDPYMQCAVYNLVGALLGGSDLPRHLSHGDKLFMRIGRVIKHSFADPDVGPVQVAAEAGISVRYLQQLFATRGTTYGRFVRACRLEHAAQLLAIGTSATGLPLVEVAFASGYRDYAHFARHFRARFGTTPGAFRGGLVRAA
jgi:AraC-like DNA-binding protein